MVNQLVNIRDKWAGAKKTFIIIGIVVLVLAILLTAFLFGFFTGKKKIILTNPLEQIILGNTNEAGQVDEAKGIEQGVLEFNEDYINYILVGLGTGYLHKSLLFENPFIEFNLDGQVWNSEIKAGMPNSVVGEIDKEDLRITISRQEAVKALLSSDITQFMKDSVASEETQIEMVAGQAELFSKGYLEMYSELTEEGDE